MQRFLPDQSTHAIESGTLDTIHPPVAARSHASLFAYSVKHKGHVIWSDSICRVSRFYA